MPLLPTGLPLCWLEKKWNSNGRSFDAAPLHDLVEDMLQASLDIHCMRDLTRGGLASALNEIAASSRVGFRIYEEGIPLQNEVKGACEILGLDPLHVANEGKLIAIVSAADAEKIPASMRQIAAAMRRRSSARSSPTSRAGYR